MHTFPKVSFYFLRHGETDHNVKKIYDESTEVHLNDKGKQQASQIREILFSLPIITVCSSPLLRAQQTKSIVLENRIFYDIVLDEFCECQSDLWHLFLAFETRSLNAKEWASINDFLFRVKKGLEKALTHEGPILLIAHGGTYWALTHLLQLEGDRKIGNCILAKIEPEEPGKWNVKQYCNGTIHV